MNPALKTTLINISWYCAKIIMFIYMTFFQKCVNNISTVIERVKKMYT